MRGHDSLLFFNYYRKYLLNYREVTRWQITKKGRILMKRREKRKGNNLISGESKHTMMKEENRNRSSTDSNMFFSVIYVRYTQGTLEADFLLQRLLLYPIEHCLEDWTISFKKRDIFLVCEVMLGRWFDHQREFDLNLSFQKNS